AQATGLGRELSPSGIVDVGFQLLFTVYNSDLGIADKLLAYAVAVIILLIFAAVAVNMVLVLAETWFLLYGGLFVLGFGGGRWTSEMAIGYYRQVLAVGFKLFGMAVVIGIGKGFIDSFLEDLSRKPGILELAVVLVAAYVFYKLADRIPSMLAGLIPGGGGGGGGSFVGGGGAVSAAGVAGAAIAAAGGVAAIAAAAAKALGGQEGAITDGATALMKAMGAGSRALSSDSMSAGLDAWGGDSSGGSGGSETSSPLQQAMGIDRDRPQSWPTFGGDSLSGDPGMGEGGAKGGQDEVSSFVNRDRNRDREV